MICVTSNRVIVLHSYWIRVRIITNRNFLQSKYITFDLDKNENMLFIILFMWDQHLNWFPSYNIWTLAFRKHFCTIHVHRRCPIAVTYIYLFQELYKSSSNCEKNADWASVTDQRTLMKLGVGQWGCVSEKFECTIRTESKYLKNYTSLLNNNFSIMEIRIDMKQNAF